MTPKFVSLFSGIGGLDLGFERAGMECVAQVEFDANCVKLLAEMFPAASQFGDIRRLLAVWQRLKRKNECYETWTQIFTILRTAAVFCGGFPCQDLSVAGARSGLAGERSGLWYAYRRLLAIVRPPWVVIENVPGLLSSNEGEDVDIILSGMEEIGYRWAYRSLDSQYAGLAQRRERVFIVGYLGKVGEPGDKGEALDGDRIFRILAEVLLEPESLCWNPPPGEKAAQDIAGTLGGSSQSGGFRTTDLDTTGAFVVGALPSAPGGYSADKAAAGHYVTGTLCLNGKGAASATQQAAEGGLLIAHALTGHQAKGGQPTQDNYVCAPLTTRPYADREAQEQNLVTHTLRASAARGSEDGTGRSVPLVAHTLRSAGADASEDGPGRGTPLVVTAFHGAQDPDVSGDVTHPLGRNNGMECCVAIGDTESDVRRLTPLECERLQGFPDGWTKGFSDSVRYKMLGNAVSVPVANWIGVRIVAAMRKENTI